MAASSNETINTKEYNKEESPYKKVWSITSKTMIHFLGSCLYLDDFKTCYSLNGLNAMPALLYKNADKTHTYQIKAYLHCSAELSTLPLADKGHRPYILALTKCQNLIRMDLKTGYIRDKIYLGNTHNYKYLSWDVFTVRAVVCSTQSKSSTGLKSFLLFNVFPLEVVGQLTVSKQVFGSDLCDANITDGMLITMHRNKKIRMFNLEMIIEMCMRFPLRLGKKVSSGNDTSATTGAIGSYPVGIPTNIEITDCPPVLLEVVCFNRDVSFGGYPWHFMYIPLDYDPLLAPNADVGCETYLVCSVANNTVIENGPLNMDSGIEAEAKAFFHMDESHRILQLSDKELIVNEFKTKDDGKTELKKVFRLTPPKIRGLLHISDEEEEEATPFMKENYSEEGYNEWSDWGTSFSGRRINNRWRKAFRKKNIIRDLNYDAELDFLLLTYVQKLEDSSFYSPPDGKLQIHCNQTGRLLKTGDLTGMGFEFRLCLMEMDMDFMIHIFAADPIGTMVCNLYRLERSPDSVGHQPVVTVSSKQTVTHDHSDSEESSEYSSDVSY